LFTKINHQVFNKTTTRIITRLSTMVQQQGCGLNPATREEDGDLADEAVA
jgi:hypothetical protein